MNKGVVLILLAIVLFFLLTSVPEMPTYGSAETPSYNEVTLHYVNNAVEDTGTTSIIAAIITDYRAFDTLGETTVLFTAIAAVLSVLSSSKASKSKA